MDGKFSVMIMSGVEDGYIFTFGSANGDGKLMEDSWTITIGRRDENDLCLNSDTYISRHHANLHWKSGQWWLEDRTSTNGTFLDNDEDFFEDQPVKGIVPLEAGQLFRVGRTWLRIQVED